MHDSALSPDGSVLATGTAFPRGLVNMVGLIEDSLTGKKKIVEKIVKIKWKHTVKKYREKYGGKI